MRIGVLLPNWVGDVAMATPTLRVLRENFAHDRLIGISRPYLIPLLDGTPWLDRIVPWEHKGTGRIAHLWRAVRQLRAEALDTLILLRATLSAGLLAELSGAKRTIGYARRALGLVLTDPVVLDGGGLEPFSTVDLYLNLISTFGFSIFDKRLELATTPANEAAADQVWKRLALPPGERILLMNLGSASAGARRWPPEYGVSLALRAAEEFGLTTLVLCGPAERQDAAAIERAANHPQVRSLATEDVSFGTTKAVIRRCRLMVTTDSGPRHIAAAMGTPTVVLCGPIDPRLSFNYHVDSIELTAPLDCRPCGRSECPLGHQRCMRDLTVDQVLRAMGQMLEITPFSVHRARHVTRAA